MTPLALAPPSTFAKIRFVLTDMDETLTYRGLLSARVYGALERLRDSGWIVIPVTAAPAGWCDQMARMWPIDGVIAENGGLFLQRTENGHGVTRRYWDGPHDRARVAARLAEISRLELPGAELADDQPFRLTSVGFRKPNDVAVRNAIVSALRKDHANVTVNNLWVLAWFGDYDKLSMARRILREVYDVDIDADRDSIVYCGDSTNDAPMFGHFLHTIGVSTVRECLADIPVPPRWITQGPGGDGFVELAEALLSSRN
ncbi:MAG TPA: HAD-IIB family hydrolase [Methylocystis sp.]|nr:HAD-IIB family hydrolase [Methylocystis sp.]